MHKPTCAGVTLGAALLLLASAPVLRAAVIPAPTAAAFQSALNQAQAGDVIVLTAGATYTGNFVLPNRGTLAGYITITSSAAAALPAGRVHPPDSANMPAIVTPNTSPAIAAADGANHFQLVGLEIRPASGIYVFDLVRFGNAAEATADVLPSNLTVDRCYLHGDPAVGGKRGIALNAKAITVQNSYLSGFASTGQDAQALCGWNGPGPFTILNNYLEASGENLMFGGATPSIQGLVPSDITVQGNYFSKPLSWNPASPSYGGTPWTVKDLLELKSAQRVSIVQNVFENCWPSAQSGFAIVMTVRTSSNVNPPEVIDNVLFQDNLIRNATSGFNFSGTDDNGLGSSVNVSIVDNVLLGVTDRVFQILNRMQNLSIRHNTAPPGVYAFIMADGAPSPGLTFNDNMLFRGTYGLDGSGYGEGIAALNHYFPGYTFLNNAIIGGDPTVYPPNNFFPVSYSRVGFVDYLDGNYALGPGSPYLNAATDGTAVGANVANVMAYAATAIQGGATGPPPPPAALTLACSTTAGPAQTGVAYSATCTAAGGRSPYVLSVSGSLPAGLSAAPAQAAITIAGTPTAAGPYSYAAIATDSSSPAQTASAAFSGTVAAPPPPLSPAASSPAGWWTFDTASIARSTAADSSGNGFAGTIYNAIAAPGKINQALSFSGTGYVAVPNAPPLDLGHNLTLAAWIRTSPQAWPQTFLSMCDFTGQGTGYLFQVLPSGALNVNIGGANIGGYSVNLSDTTNVADGSWHYVTAAITLGQDVRFYLDGQLSSIQTARVRASYSAAPLYLGTNPGAQSGGPFIGVLDEVRIYSAALQAGDIAALAGLR
jgi:hypothetical protein